MATTAIEPLLRRGSSGDAVRQLQQALQDLGFSPGAVDGQFGPTTESAVKAFQRHVGIHPDGVCGEITWTNIDEADQSEPVLRKGSRGLPVRRLQKRSTLAGFEMGGVDGTFGAKTESGVRTIQRDHHLHVDGVVGPQTWAVVAAFGH